MVNASVDEMELEVAEHPLLNSVIVTHVFELLQKSNYITAKNVNSLRYVCKTWYSLSLPMFRSVATIRLGPENVDNNSKALFPITEFLQHFQNPDNDPHEFQNLPFKNYVISSFTLSDYTFLRDIDSPQNFWDTIGPLVNQLTFENCTFPGNDTQPFKRILNQKLPNLQNLYLLNNKTDPPAIRRNDNDLDAWAENERVRNAEILSQGLIPRNRNLKYLEVRGKVPMDVLTLLINSFNLETLKLRNKTNSALSIRNLIHAWSLMDMLRINLGERPECKLTALDVMHSQFFNCIYLPLHRLGSYKLPLARVTIELNIDLNVTNVFVPLLESHTDTLKVLKVYRPPVFGVLRDKLFRWVMPKLEELHIWGNLVRNFDFLPNLPNLQILMINTVCYDKADIMQNYFCPQGTVLQMQVFSKRYNPFKGNMLDGMSLSESEYFRLEFMEELHLDLKLMTDRMVQMLARWMPNLKRFRTNLNTVEAFRAVCKWMPNLEELGILYGGQLNNETVTGISENVGEERNIYNITRLKNLKRFHQQLPACNYKGILSDQAVYEGFLKMESLEWISVPVSQEMSEEAEEALTEREIRVHFIRSYGDNPHVDDGFCCKRNIFLSVVDEVGNHSGLRSRKLKL